MTVSNIAIVTISLRFVSSWIRPIFGLEEIRYPGNSFLVNRVSWVSYRHVCVQSLETNTVENKYRNITGDNWWRLSVVIPRAWIFLNCKEPCVHLGLRLQSGLIRYRYHGYKYTYIDRDGDRLVYNTRFGWFSCAFSWVLCCFCFSRASNKPPNVVK